MCLNRTPDADRSTGLIYHILTSGLDKPVNRVIAFFPRCHYGGERKNVHQRRLCLVRDAYGVLRLSGLEHRVQTAVDGRDGRAVR